MSAAAAYLDARRLGLVLIRDGRTLCLSGGAKPDPALLVRLREHKNEILEIVSANRAQAGWSRADWTGFFNERAAICEHEGGLLRPAAEAHALDECLAHGMPVRTIRAGEGAP